MKNQKLLLGILAIIVAIGAIAFATKQPAATGSAVKIGVFLPQTGDYATSGEKMMKGIRLAQEGIPADKATFVFEDTNSKTATAITVAQKLLDVDKVDVLIGPYDPNAVATIAPLAAAKGVALFTPDLCIDDFKDGDLARLIAQHRQAKAFGCQIRHMTQAIHRRPGACSLVVIRIEAAHDLALSLT